MCFHIMLRAHLSRWRGTSSTYVRLQVTRLCYAVCTPHCLRSGKLHHVKAPSTAHLLFQIGETSQIHTGGLLQATPHAVRGACIPGVSRAAFAVFMEPNWGGDMQSPADRKPEEAQSSMAEEALPSGVPSLKSRWGTSDCPFTTCNFGDFTKATLGALH